MKRAMLFVLASVICGCGDDARTPTPMDAGAGGGDAGPAVDAGGQDAGRALGPAMPPGSACTCDAECEGDDQHPGVCVFGVCMTRATGACSDSGSSVECAAGSRCWGLSGVDGALCWPDCDAFTCAGECDADGSCVPTEGMTCDPTCGGVCPADGAPCSVDNPGGYCGGESESCVDGVCVERCSPSNPAGFCPPGSECTDGACIGTGDCPDWRCVGSDCGTIVEMPGATSPTAPEARAAGYYVASPRYRYLRRDLTLLVQYAACMVANRYPGTNPLGLADLSQSDGQVPGTDTGRQRHPDGTHRGSDLDIAYYQTDGVNDPQIICGDGSDDNGNGRPGTFNDGYFCTTEDNIVDWPRQAYFFAMMAVTPLVRVFGIDETLADDFEREINALLSAGEIEREQARRALSLGYGNDGGWAFHHHHVHLSFSRP